MHKIDFMVCEITAPNLKDTKFQKKKNCEELGSNVKGHAKRSKKKYEPWL